MCCITGQYCWEHGTYVLPLTSRCFNHCIIAGYLHASLTCGLLTSELLTYTIVSISSTQYPFIPFPQRVDNKLPSNTTNSSLSTLTFPPVTYPHTKDTDDNYIINRP